MAESVEFLLADRAPRSVAETDSARQGRTRPRRGAFHQAWHDFLPQVRAQQWTADTACNHCELIAMCGQCPGWARMETGDQEARVSYLCQVAHLRAEALGLNGYDR